MIGRLGQVEAHAHGKAMGPLARTLGAIFHVEWRRCRAKMEKIVT